MKGTACVVVIRIKVRKRDVLLNQLFQPVFDDTPYHKTLAGQTDSQADKVQYTVTQLQETCHSFPVDIAGFVAMGQLHVVIIKIWFVNN